MAFCSKCGAKLEDGTKFCGTCGAEQEAPLVQEEAPAAQAEAPKAEAAEAAKGAKTVDKNKMVGLIAFAAVAVVVIVLVAVLFSNIFGGGYKKPLKTVKKAINSQTTDVDDFFGAVPKFVGAAYDDALALVKDIDKDMVKELEDGIEEGLDTMYEGLEDTYGKNVKLTYKITDKEKLDKDECEELAENYTNIVDLFEESFGIDVTDDDELEEMVEKLEDSGMLDDVSSKQVKKAIKLISDLANNLEDVEISKGYLLTVDVTLEGKEDDATNELELYVVKMNGKWCIEILSTYADMQGTNVESAINSLIRQLKYLM